jgi:hypothetical protein
MVAEGLIGQNLQQQSVGHTAIDDVNRIHPALGGVQGSANLRQHAAADGAVGKQLVNAVGPIRSVSNCARFVQTRRGCW